MRGIGVIVPVVAALTMACCTPRPAGTQAVYAPPPPAYAPAPAPPRAFANRAPYREPYAGPPPAFASRAPRPAPDETDYDLPGGVLFERDSARISAGARPVLSQIAQAALDRPGAMLIVQGHTDTSGTKAHNQKLSEDRACAVADALIRAGVPENRIRAEGLGEAGLAFQTPDGVREPANRRVVVRLIARGRAGDGGDRRERMD